VSGQPEEYLFQAHAHGMHTQQAPSAADDGSVMGFRHATLPIHGVQFHPESVLTEGGHEMLANWLTDCGFPEVRDKLRDITPVTINSQYATEQQ
jgi:GMP synthase-like glutamine amidotransferase